MEYEYVVSSNTHNNDDNWEMKTWEVVYFDNVSINAESDRNAHENVD